jgi:hypothetical protein
MWFIGLGAAIVVAAALVGIAFAVGVGDEEGGPVSSGACVRQEFPDQGRTHVEKLAKDFKRNSFPGSSGPHSAQTAIWNVYDRSVPELNLVHNLEHGGVVVQYGSEIPPAAVDRIVTWYAEDPNGIIVAPLPQELPAQAPADAQRKIFLTAWTQAATCSTFDEEAFSDFRDDYRGEGPERFPVDSLAPGGP